MTRSTAITFPVFDIACKTAIVIVTIVEHDGLMRFKGESREKRVPSEIAVDAWIYRKIGNRWRRTATEWLAVS